MIKLCVTLISLRPENKTSQIVEDLNKIIPSRNPLLKLEQYRINPTEINDDTECEISIIYSTKHRNPCQRIIDVKPKSYRDNCLIGNGFWTMSEMGAICSNPFIHSFSENPSQSHTETLGISILNLFGINPTNKNASSVPLSQNKWAFFDSSCQAYQIDLKLSQLLLIPDLFRQNECLKHKMIIDCRLVNFDIIFLIIIAFITPLNIFIICKIIHETRKIRIKRKLSFSKTYIRMETLY